jgi:hypothetical protein
MDTFVTATEMPLRSCVVAPEVHCLHCLICLPWHPYRPCLHCHRSHRSRHCRLSLRYLGLASVGTSLSEEIECVGLRCTCHSPAVCIAYHLQRLLKAPSVANYVVESTLRCRFESYSAHHLFNRLQTVWSFRGSIGECSVGSLTRRRRNDPDWHQPHELQPQETSSSGSAAGLVRLYS